MVFYEQSLRYAQKIILGILKHMPVVIFFACLDLEQKSSFMDGHYLNFLPIFIPEKCVL
jgi:hypothetical protein